MVDYDRALELLQRLDPGVDDFMVAGIVPTPIRDMSEFQVALVTYLTLTGVNLAVSQQARDSLGEAKFRNLVSGRGPGFTEVLGEAKAVEALDITGRIAEEYASAGHSAGTPERGLDQAIADLLTIVVGNPDDQEKAFRNLHRRVWKGYRRLCIRHSSKLSGKLGAVDAAFAGFEMPSELLASAPVGGVVQAFSEIFQE